MPSRPSPHFSMSKDTPKLKKLAEMRAAVEAGGGPERVAKIHDSGRLTARERINLLFEPKPEVHCGLN